MQAGVTEVWCLNGPIHAGVRTESHLAASDSSQLLLIRRKMR